MYILNITIVRLNFDIKMISFSPNILTQCQYLMHCQYNDIMSEYQYRLIYLQSKKQTYICMFEKLHFAHFCNQISPCFIGFFTVWGVVYILKQIIKCPGCPIYSIHTSTSKNPIRIVSKFKKISKTSSTLISMLIPKI